MSLNSLTGYDNTDQNTQEADSEVYRYSADTGELACASCDPHGARPVGSAFIGAELDAWASSPFYQPRALSDDGSRLFFSSPSPLVPGVRNSHVNVFEYEHSAVQLISSGTDESDDVFLDASPSGNDVFFAARQSLVESDQDQLVDVYDARVAGGFPSPAPPALCSGSVCQGSPSVPPALPSAISATFTGAGNLPAPTARRIVKAKKPAAKRKSKKRRTSKRTSKKRRAHTHERARHATAVSHRRSAS
jgi:hypothetical protein